MSEIIDFKPPYNNKLRCDCFTAILMDNAAYKKGAIVEISVCGFKKGKAKIYRLSRITLPKVNDWMAKLDAACDAKKFTEDFKANFKNRPAINWETEPLVYLMLEWVDKDRMNSSFEKK